MGSPRSRGADRRGKGVLRGALMEELFRTTEREQEHRTIGLDGKWWYIADREMRELLFSKLQRFA